MKKVILVFTVLIFLFGCDVFDNNSSEGKKDLIEDLNVSEDFNYETTEEVEVQIRLLDRGNIPVPGIFFSIYDKDPDENGNLMAKGVTDVNGSYFTTINISNLLDNIVVIGYMNTYEVEVSNGSAILELGGAGSSERIADAIESPKDGFFNYINDYNANGIPSDMGTDYIDAEFLQRIDEALPERKPVPEYHPEYLAEGSQLNTVLEEDAEVWVTFVNEGAGYKNSLGYYTYNVNDGAPADINLLQHNIIFPNVSYYGNGNYLNPGDKVYLGQFEAGTVIGWFLVANGWTNGSVSEVRTRYYSNPEFNPEEAQYQQHNVFLHDEDSGKFLLAFEDLLRPGGDNDFNDAVFYVTSNPIDAIDPGDVVGIEGEDSDDDGVSDLYDDYPNDPERAFDNYYPSENGWGTLAFEDYWPRKGDYDMNDLVVNYHYHTIHSPENKLKDIIGTIEVRAIGASYHNGFAIELPIVSSNILDYSGDIEGVEQNNNLAVVNVFNDAYDVINPPGEGFVNTEEGMEYFEPESVIFGVTLIDPVDLSSLNYQLPYNPFIRVNGDLEKEIHLPNMRPTPNADTSLFGTEDDNTSMYTDNFYKSYDNLPWAINIPCNWYYPKERNEITWGYRYFAEWAESSGTVHEDWYEFNEENVNENYIYLAQ